MSNILQWIKNIAFYLILISIILNILPGKNYKKYVKLFTGFLLVYFVAKPVLQDLNLDTLINDYYKSYQEFIEDNSEMISANEVEKRQKERVLNGYESKVKEGIIETVKEEGFEVSEIRISWSGKNTEYGKIKNLELAVTKSEKETVLIQPIIPEEKQEETQEDSNILKQILAKEYQIEENKIEITVCK